MLTTTFAKPYTMELTMPVKSNEPSQVNIGSHYHCARQTASGALLPRAEFAAGQTVPLPSCKPPLSPPTASGRPCGPRSSSAPALVVLIKPAAEAKYQDMVDILDEMNITPPAEIRPRQDHPGRPQPS